MIMSYSNDYYTTHEEIRTNWISGERYGYCDQTYRVNTGSLKKFIKKIFHK